MPDLEPELRQIVERAAGLDERLGPHFAATGTLADATLEQWRRAAGAGNPARFRARLAWSGLGEGDAERALARVRLANGWLPEWAGTLRAILHACRVGAPVHPAPAAPQGDEQPFEAVLHPVASLALRALDARVPATPRVRPEARAALERALVRALARLAAPVLLEAFTAFRAARLPSPGDAADAAHGEFTAAQRHGGFAELLGAHPVLARLLAVAVDQWVSATAEFLRRLEQSLPRIAAELNGGADPGAVTMLQPGISDPHGGGRTAVTVDFEHGPRVVYKPRDLGMERAWNALLAWMNDAGAPHPLRTLAIVGGADGGHGWMEFARAHPCADADEAAAYHARAGALLCVAYALGAVDMHLENVVAAGAHPVLVDLETVLQPVPSNGYAGVDRARAAATQGLFNETVLGTGLAPVWQMGPTGVCFDPSGYTGGSGAQAPFTTRTVWTGVGTDAVAPRREPAPVQRGHNVAVTAADGGELECDVAAHAGDLARGFRETWRFMAARRERLLAEEGPLAPFRGRPVRFLFRPSATYAHVLEQSLQPPALRCGAQRGVRLELTARAFATANGVLPLWPVHAQEVRELEALDIPLLTVDSGATALGPVDGCFAEPALGRALRRIAALDEAGLGRQERVLASALAVRFPAAASSSPGAPAIHAGADPFVDSPEGWTAEAARIGRELARAAVPTAGGGVTWVTLAALGPAGRHRIEPAGFGLHGGNAGIALFLAALAARTEDAEARALAYAALAPARGVIAQGAEAAARLARECGPAAESWGGLVHALSTAGTLLGDRELVDDARRLALAGDAAASPAEAVLGLLSLHAATGDADVLARADAAGALLAAAPVSALPPAAAARDAHGVLGPAWALLRLAAATGTAAHRTVALRRLADPRVRALAGRAAAVPGHTLVQLATLHALNPAAAASAPAPDPALPAADTLAEGALGVAAALHEAGRRAGRGELEHAGRQVAARALQRARHDGGYRLRADLGTGAFDAGLFRGVAGIGYICLRLADPRGLPCPFLWS